MSNATLCQTCPLHFCYPWQPTPKKRYTRRNRRRASHFPRIPKTTSVPSADKAAAAISDAISSSTCPAAPADGALGGPHD